jgi:hypothetical protein
MEVLPGGFRNHSDQPHSFALYGWGAALTGLHISWRAVAEWHLNDAVLSRLKLLIVPDSQVFPAEDVAVLERWVRRGGALIVTGGSGQRLGESGNFDKAPGRTTLAVLLAGIDLASGGAAPLGKGRLEYLPRDPGEIYYKATSDRPGLLPMCADAIEKVAPIGKTFSVVAPGVPYTLGITPYVMGDELLVDINNTDIDMDSDSIHSTGVVRFDVALPKALIGARLSVRVLTPDPVPACRVAAADSGRALVTLGPISRYACVIIERAD